MRTWRKVHASILDSEQVAQLSDGAIVLLTFLIVAQDDTGFYPWTDTKVRRLVATRPKWSLKKTKTLADEIVSAGIAHWEDGGIILDSGERLNGKPRSDVAELKYQRENTESTDTTPLHDVPTDVTPTDTPRPRDVSSRVEKRRVEKRREEKEKSSSTPVPLPAAAAHPPPDSSKDNLANNVAYSTNRVATAFVRKFGDVLPDEADAEIALFLSRDSPVPLQVLFAAIDEAAEYKPERPWAYTKAIVERRMERRRNGDKPEPHHGAVDQIDPDKYVRGRYANVVQRGLDPPDGGEP